MEFSNYSGGIIGGGYNCTSSVRGACYSSDYFHQNQNNYQNVKFFAGKDQETSFSTTSSISISDNSMNRVEIGIFLVKLYILLGLTWYICTKTFLRKIPGLTPLIEMGLSNLTTLFLSPILITSFLSILIARTVLKIYLKMRYGDKVFLMKGNDAFWALDEFANSSNITVKFIVEDQDFNIEKVRYKFLKDVLGKVIEIDGKKVEIYGDRFKCLSTKYFGFYCWQRVPKDQFNIKNHVKFISQENENGASIDEAGFFDELSKVYDYPLSGNQPQFEILIAQNYQYKTGIPGKKYYAIAFRIMHSYLDGCSLGNLLKNAMSEKEIDMTVDSVTYPPKTLLVKTFAWIYIVFFGMRSFFRTLLLQESNCFHNVKELTGPKKFGWCKPICVKKLRIIKNKSKTTTTSVLYSCLAGSLRSLAIKKGYPVPRKIHAFPTIAMLPYPNWYPQNRFTVSLLPLSIGLESRIDRLRSAYKYVEELERSPDILMSFNVMKVTGFLPAFVSKFILNLAHATLLISNNPGPVQQTEVFGGGKLVEVGCFSPLKSRLGIGMCLFSYAGRIRVCIHVDKSACPDESDVDHLLRGFEEEIAGYASHFGINDDEIFVP